MRNPKLFYEAAFIARPKLQDALSLRQSRSRQASVAEKVTSAYSPASSTGTGHTGSGVSTPDSLKGNLRKDISLERRPTGEKKRVQFDLQKSGCGNGLSVAEDTDEEEGDEADEFDEIEKSLMRGFTEYDMVASGHSTKKKPQLRLDFGFLSPANSRGQRGERIDAELPLDQQTYVYSLLVRMIIMSFVIAISIQVVLWRHISPGRRRYFTQLFWRLLHCTSLWASCSKRLFPCHKVSSKKLIKKIQKNPKKNPKFLKNLKKIQKVIKKFLFFFFFFS
jgi:hypothetical protein